VSRRAILLSVAVIVAAWYVLALIMRTPILPTPWTVALALVTALPKGLAWHLAVSTYRVVVSILVSVALAVPMGLAMGQSQRLNRLTAPLIYLTYPIPKIVFLPIVLLVLGIGEVSKIFIISLILFFQVLVVVRDAASGVRPELVSSVRSLGARRRHVLRYVYLPASLPAIITALRLSAGTAIAVLFFAESFATRAGLGYYIMVESWGRLAYAEMYAGVVAMSLLGLALYFAMDVLDRRWCAWVQAGR